MFVDIPPRTYELQNEIQLHGNIVGLLKLWTAAMHNINKL